MPSLRIIESIMGVVGILCLHLLISEGAIKSQFYISLRVYDTEVILVLVIFRYLSMCSVVIACSEFKKISVIFLFLDGFG